MKNWNLKHLGLLACGFALLAFILPGMAQQPKKQKSVPILDPVKKVEKSPAAQPKVIALKLKGSNTITKIESLESAKNTPNVSPKPLSSTQRLDLLKTGGGVTTAAAGTSVNTFLRLTAREPYVSGKPAWLAFSNPEVFNAGNNIVSYDNAVSHLRTVHLEMKVPRAGRYLIEYGLSGENQRFRLKIGGVAELQEISGVTADRPVVLVLDATASNSYYVALHGMESKSWNFHYIEVTQLN